jgi:transposase
VLTIELLIFIARGTVLGQDAMRYQLSDDDWTRLEPLVIRATRYRQGVKPLLSDRQFLEALLYLARTGVPWRDLPSEFGSWDAVYNRFRRWEASGRWRRLFELITATPELGDVRRLFVDSTIVRVHQHGSGARKKKVLKPRAVLAGV